MREKEPLKVYIEDDIIIAEFYEDSDTVEEMYYQMDLLKSSVNKLLDSQVKGKIDALVDYSRIKLSVMIDSKTSNNYIKVIKNPKLNNIAIVLTDHILKGFAIFITKLSGKSKKIKIFKTRKEALKWLKS